MQPGFISAVLRVLGRWMCLQPAKCPHVGSEGRQQIWFLGLLPLPLGKPCYPLSFYKAESYPDAWIQHILWLNSQCNLTILDGLPQPCHNLSTGPHSENLLPGGLFSSFRVAWPQSIHLSMISKSQNRTCHPSLYPFSWRTGNLSLPVILQVPC